MLLWKDNNKSLIFNEEYGCLITPYNYYIIYWQKYKVKM